MLYESTVTNVQEAFDFAHQTLTSNGWVQLESLGVTDAVYSKDASIWRISDASFIKNERVDNPTRIWPHLVVRGYTTWDTETSTGTGEFGNLGPFFQAIRGVVNDTYTATLFHPDDVVNNSGAVLKYLFGTSTRTPGWDPYHGGLCVNEYSVGTVDCYTQLWSIPLFGNSYYHYDYVYSSPYGIMGNAGAITHDKYTHEMKYVGPALQKLAGIQMAQITWSDGAATGHSIQADLAAHTDTDEFLVTWDGDDFIYFGNTYYTPYNKFYKYSLSTGVVTELADAVYGRLSTNMPHRTDYIPAHKHNFTDTGGNPTDILVVLETSSSKIHIYRVSDNTWTSIAIPLGFTPQSTLIWDGDNYIFVIRETCSLVSRYDLTTDTWVSSTAITGAQGVSNSTSAWYVDWENGALRLNVDGLPTTMKIIVNDDTFSMVTHGGDKRFWVHCAPMNSFQRYSTSITSPVTAGTSVSVPVTSTVGFVGGKTVSFYKDGAFRFKAAVYSVTDENTLTFIDIPEDVDDTYTIGDDVHVPTISSQTGYVVTNHTNTTDYVRGKNSMAYTLRPLLPSWDAHISTGAVVLWPMIAEQLNESLYAYGLRGSVKNLHYASYTTASSSPAADDTIYAAGTEYLALGTPPNKYIDDHVGFIVLGPTNA